MNTHDILAAITKTLQRRKSKGKDQIKRVALAQIEFTHLVKLFMRPCWGNTWFAICVCDGNLQLNVVDSMMDDPIWSYTLDDPACLNELAQKLAFFGVVVDFEPRKR